MLRFVSAGLYLVTSQALSMGRATLEIAAAAMRAGVRLVQLREKDMNTRQFAALAEKMRELTLEWNALLIINDRVDVALGVGADGVHLGQDDFPVAQARQIAPSLIIGASTHNEAEAVEAEAAGASYVNIGPLFPTRTKEWGEAFLGLEGMRRISGAVGIPFTVMGGIKKEHIPRLVANGARVIAVVTAVTAAPDPEAASRELLGMIRA